MDERPPCAAAGLQGAHSLDRPRDNDWALSNLVDAPTRLHNNVTKQGMTPLRLWYGATGSCSAEQCSAVQYGAVQCSAVHYSVVQDMTLQLELLRRSHLAAAVLPPRACCALGR